MLRSKKRELVGGGETEKQETRSGAELTPLANIPTWTQTMQYPSSVGLCNKRANAC